MNRRFLILSALALAVAACQSAPATTSRPGTTSRPAATAQVRPTSGATQSTAGGPEPGVIKGTVTDEQGDPIAGAQVRLAGYTDDFTGTDSNLVTDGSGMYRVEVIDGLFDVVGTATIDFEGSPYVFDLRPADGDCRPQESASGIVKDLVLELSGLDICSDEVDPTNTGSYNGATVALIHNRPRGLPAETNLVFTMEPVGPLADGSAGRTVTFTRTAAALETTFGPLDGTGSLYDIPLGRYRLSGTATLPDGSTQDLRFALELGDVPTESVEVGFEPYQSPPYGIRVRTIQVMDAGWRPGG
jgi:hypothetical protein